MPDPADQLQDALELAHRYLDRRERSAAEVRRHLEGHGLPTSTVDAAMRVLTEQRYVDDVRFASLFAHDKRELAEWGSDRIRRALATRGVDREVIAQALESESREHALHRATELLRRRFAIPPSSRLERDRALGLLLRKGYDTELAFDALTAYVRRAARDEFR